jgi:hypothetical protein
MQHISPDAPHIPHEPLVHVPPIVGHDEPLGVQIRFTQHPPPEHVSPAQQASPAAPQGTQTPPPPPPPPLQTEPVWHTLPAQHAIPGAPHAPPSLPPPELLLLPPSVLLPLLLPLPPSVLLPLLLPLPLPLLLAVPLLLPLPPPLLLLVESVEASSPPPDVFELPLPHASANPSAATVKIRIRPAFIDRPPRDRESNLHARRGINANTALSIA